MDRVIVEERLEELFRLKEILRADKAALIREFYNEFPMRKPWTSEDGKLYQPKGYVITKTECSKKDCNECPHTLKWVWFERRVNLKKPYWGKKKHDRLPINFWNSRRKPDVLARFRYYDDRLQKLNKDHADVKETIASIAKKALYCLRRAG